MLWIWPAELAACLLLAATAGAQTLDLSAPPEPAPGDGTVLLALAGTLADERGAIQPSSPHARARAALRDFAHAALARSEELGPDASPIALLARTIAARRADLDAAIDAADPDDAWLAALLLERLTTPNEWAADDATHRRLDTGLRDALAPLLQSPPPANAGWMPVAGDPASLDAALAHAPPATADLFRAAAESPAHAASARRAARLLGAAAGVLDPPAWLDDPAPRTLADAFERAAAGLADPARASGSISTLESLDAWHALISALDDGSGDAAAVAARRAVSDALADGPRDSEAFRRLLRTLTARLDDNEFADLEPGLAQYLRPAWRLVELRRLDARRRLLHDLDRVLAAPTTDPGVLARLDALRRTGDGLRGLAELSGVLTGVHPGDAGPARPGIAPRFDRVADRLIELARRLERDADDDAPSRLLETLAEWSVRHAEWPGEPALRDADHPLWAAMGEIAGEDPSAMLAAIDDTRARWLDAWADAAGPGALAGATARHEAWRSALGLVHDAATLSRARGGMRANAWPGWELSPAGLDAITEGLDEAARRAWGDARAGSRGWDLGEAHAPARLAALIERRCAGLDPDPLAELTAGAPIDALCWGAATRDRIARVCRYAEEAAASGDAAMLGYVRTQAAEALAGEVADHP